jgi:hypothetical protein
VLIVDENTGRVMPGRRWSDGLHQAVEAKEGVAIERETRTYATITIQNYFRMYEKLAGMTGTAETEATEFNDIYRLAVQVIPTNRPCIRTDRNDSIFKTRRDKYTAVVREIEAANKRGQPVLVGTTSVESSEVLSRMLQAHGGDPHGPQRQVPPAGGRDRLPRGAPRRGHHRHQHGGPRHRHQAGGGRSRSPATEGKAPGTCLPAVTEAGPKKGGLDVLTEPSRGERCELEGVRDLTGGLIVIGTERHESRRVDRQLRGRCSRQGDPGLTKFFLSLEDDLMRLFLQGNLASRLMEGSMKEGEELEHPGSTARSSRRRKRSSSRTSRSASACSSTTMSSTSSGGGLRHPQRRDPRGPPKEIIFEQVEEEIGERLAMAGFGEKIEPNPVTLDSLVGWVNAHFPIGLKQEELTGGDPEALRKLILDRIKAGVCGQGVGRDSGGPGRPRALRGDQRDRPPLAGAPDRDGGAAPRHPACAATARRIRWSNTRRGLHLLRGADEERAPADLHRDLPERLEPRVVREHAFDPGAGASAPRGRRTRPRPRRRRLRHPGASAAAPPRAGEREVQLPKVTDPPRAAEGRPQRSVPLRQRQEIQALPRRLNRSLASTPRPPSGDPVRSAEPPASGWQRPESGRGRGGIHLTAVLTVASFPPFRAPEFAYAFAAPAIFWAYRRPPLQALRLDAFRRAGRGLDDPPRLAAARDLGGLLFLGPFVGAWVGSWYLAVPGGRCRGCSDGRFRCGWPASWAWPACGW